MTATTRGAKSNAPPEEDPARDHATQLFLRVCELAGSTTIIDDARASLEAEGVAAAIRDRNTAALFDWLVSVLSYQGISDQVAFDYMERHGRATWGAIESDLRHAPSCPKLRSYWHFHDCRYNKTRFTCAEPDHLAKCPLPNHWLRNGRLNQTAYSLYLFIRDVADGDLIGWIDRLRRRPRSAISCSASAARKRAAGQPSLSDCSASWAHTCLIAGKRNSERKSSTRAVSTG
jgi:hypothetical protein